MIPREHLLGLQAVGEAGWALVPFGGAAEAIATFGGVSRWLRFGSTSTEGVVEVVWEPRDTPSGRLLRLNINASGGASAAWLISLLGEMVGELPEGLLLCDCNMCLGARGKAAAF